MFSSKIPKFNPGLDIPDLSRKVILVTGGNNGLGRESILQLAKHKPAKIFMGARSETRGMAAIDEIKKSVPDADIVLLKMDLSSLASIKKAADEVSASTDRLDILMNNAGVMALPPGLTEDGYEIQFGTNHMGHALLTKLLLPLLEKTASISNSDVRIVNLTSKAWSNAPKAGLCLSEVKSPMASIGTITRYGHSKLANIYFTNELARRYPNIKSVSVHPGVVNTNLAAPVKQAAKYTIPIFFIAGKLFFSSVEDGALNQLWAAAAKQGDVQQAGLYYPVGVKFEGSAMLLDQQKAAELWDFTEKELAQHGY